MISDPQKENRMYNLDFKSNVKAILECNFAGFKDEIIENACKLICDLKINDDTQKENNVTINQKS